MSAARAERRHMAVEVLHHERPLRGLYGQPVIAHRVDGIDRHRGVARQHRRLADAVGRDRRLHELVALREKAALGLGIAAEPAALGCTQVENALSLGRETAFEIPAVGCERHVRDELRVVPHDAAAVHRPLRRDRAAEHECAKVRIARLPDERQRPLGHLVLRADGDHDRLAIAADRRVDVVIRRQCDHAARGRHLDDVRIVRGQALLHRLGVRREVKICARILVVQDGHFGLPVDPEPGRAGALEQILPLDHDAPSKITVSALVLCPPCCCNYNVA